MTRGIRTALALLVGLSVLLVAGVLVWQAGPDREARELEPRLAAWERSVRPRWERPTLRGETAPGNAAEAQAPAIEELRAASTLPWGSLADLESDVDGVLAGGAIDGETRAAVAALEPALAKLRATTSRTWAWDAHAHASAADRLAAVRLLGVAALMAEPGTGCFDVLADATRVIQDGMTGHGAVEEEARAAAVVFLAGVQCGDRASARELTEGAALFRALAASSPWPAERLEVQLRYYSEGIRDSHGGSSPRVLLREGVGGLLARSGLIAAWREMMVAARHLRRHRRAPTWELLDWAVRTDERWRATGAPFLSALGLSERVALDGAIQVMVRGLAAVLEVDRALVEEGLGDGPPRLLLSSTLRDPFSGRPFLVRAGGETTPTWVYSVGPNGLDEGGLGDDLGAPLAPRDR